MSPRALDELDRPFALASIASAVLRQLDAALAASRHEEVASLSRRLLAADLDLPELAEHRARARAALPEALVAIGRHADASRAFAELAAASEDPAERREAELRAALALVSGRSCGQAARPLRAFVTAHAEGGRSARRPGARALAARGVPAPRHAAARGRPRRARGRARSGRARPRGA
ncbi:MAG: hypothetical protein M5U28_35615 [Sandaracinaceae bacterium]|nr:hypothetical protein [Sandaracinaceae bacterium]